MSADTQHEAAMEAAARFLYEGSTDAMKRARAGNPVAFDELNIVVRKAWITKAEGSRAAYDAALGERRSDSPIAELIGELEAGMPWADAPWRSAV